MYVSHNNIVLLVSNSTYTFSTVYSYLQNSTCCSFCFRNGSLMITSKSLKKIIKIQQGRIVMIGRSHIVCKSPYLFHDDQELTSCFTDDGGCADPSVYQCDFLKYQSYNLLAYQKRLPE